MRVGMATESVWPRPPLHADAGLVAARITEMAAERQAARLLIEIHDEQAVVTVFAGVQNAWKRRSARRVTGAPDPLYLEVVHRDRLQSARLERCPSK
jgi:hypothetical protein